MGKEKPGDKIVAKSMRNAEFQEKRNGDLAVLFFKESCPYCRDFKPTWNRVAKGLNTRWLKDSVVYDEDEQKLAKPPTVCKVDVAKFANIQRSIGFPTVPTVALYKRGEPVVFLTTKDRSLPNVLRLVEDYYKRHRLPPEDEHLVGNNYGQWPKETNHKASDDKTSDGNTSDGNTSDRKTSERQSLREARKIVAYDRPPTIKPEQKEKTSEKPVREQMISEKPVREQKPKNPSPKSAQARPVESAREVKSTKPTPPARREEKEKSSEPAERERSAVDDIFAKLLAKLVKNKNNL